MSSVREPVIRWLELGAALTVLLGACSRPLEVPKNTALDSVSHDPKFPIAAAPHQLDCNDCHGDFDTFREFTCISCHDHAKEVTDPLHEGLTGYVHDRKSCFTCHPRSERYSPAEHSKFFPIGPGTRHAAQICEDCHEVKMDRKQYTCVSCHEHDQPTMAGAHEGLADYVWESARCLACHPDGNTIPRTDHDRFFPISSETVHREASCKECHPGDKTPETIVCIDCHEAHAIAPSADQHTAVGGYRFESPLCLRCHVDSSVYALAQHAPFRISEGSKHPPSEVACLACHTSSLAEKPYATDFVPYTCTDAGCHPCSSIERKHRRISGFCDSSMTCVQSRCHPTGAEDDD